MYFSHDTDARNSEKILSVRMEMGAEGYGLYYMLLEKLAAEKSHRLTMDLAKIAWDLRTEEEKLRRLINNYGLFDTNEEKTMFWSNGLLTRMEKADAISQVRSEAGKASGESRRRKANIADYKSDSAEQSNKQRTNNEQNNDFDEQKSNRINEIKGKEIKENKIKEKSSSSKTSSTELVSETDEAAGAAEEEEEEENFEEYLFELWEKAHKAMRQVKTPAGLSPEEWNRICWRLSTPKYADRRKVMDIVSDMTRNGNTATRILYALEECDRLRPMSCMPWEFWTTIDCVMGLTTKDANKIRQMTGGNKDKWHDLMCAVADCKRAPAKITQPARYIISKLTD